ncbi:MAG: hypothetical protein AAF411_16850 [Myxococcota bacterium]
MKIEADAFLEHDAQLVFETYRDELPRLVQGLQQIRDIVVESRREAGDEVHLVNRWQGASPVPKIAERVLPTQVAWLDHASWNTASKTTHWRIESQVFAEAIDCTGVNRFVDLGGATRLEVRGELRIDLSKVRLMPDMVSAPIASAIERFLVAQITPSVAAVSDALAAYLADETLIGA